MGSDVEPSEKTYELLDEARAWIEAAWDGLDRQLDAGLAEGRVDRGAFLAMDCAQLVGYLETAGAQPTGSSPPGSAELPPEACLDKAAAALTLVPAAERPIALLPAWAELRALILRMSELPTTAPATDRGH